jgi:hypothetical protein
MERSSSTSKMRVPGFISSSFSQTPFYAFSIGVISKKRMRAGRAIIRRRARERMHMADAERITWDPEADRRIKRSPFLMRRFIRKRIEDRVASRGRAHVTEADVDESAGMYRQYRFK